MKTLRHHLHQLYLQAQYALQPQCAFCGLPRIQGYPLCQACHDELPWLTQNQHPIPAGCDSSITALAYQAPIKGLLRQAKFGKQLREADTLGEITAAAIAPQIATLPDAILPVPLHPTRMHQRGFNQALELARPLAQQLGVPLLTQAVIRRKATQAQAQLNAQLRQTNIQHAFQLVTPLPYTHIALFDDVITTGATLHALAQLLRANGVKHIQAWSCARPLLRRKHEVGQQIDYH